MVVYDKKLSTIIQAATPWTGMTSVHACKNKEKIMSHH